MKTIVFSFMRANPPHSGHELIVDAVKEIANELKCDYGVCLSLSHDTKKNPLEPKSKLKYFKHFFPNIKTTLDTDLFCHLKKLSEHGYERVILVCGSDRADKYSKELNKQNGKAFDFKQIDICIAGSERTISNISASKMREYVVASKVYEFKRCLPKNADTIISEQLYIDTQKGLNV